MGKVVHFRNLHEENSSEIPVNMIYRNLNPIFKLFSANQIGLNNCKPVESELLRYVLA